MFPLKCYAENLWNWSPRAFPTFDRCVPPIILFSWVSKMFLNFPLLFHRYRNMQMPQLVQHKLVAQSSLYDSRFPIRSHISIHNKKHGVDLLSAVSNPRFHHCILRGKQHELSQRKKRAWWSQSICRRKRFEFSFVWIQRTGSFHGTIWLHGSSGVSLSGSYCTQGGFQFFVYAIIIVLVSMLAGHAHQPVHCFS